MCEIVVLQSFFFDRATARSLFSLISRLPYGIFVFPEIQPWVLSSYVDLAPAGDSVNYKTPAIIEKLVYRLLFCTVGKLRPGGIPGAASVALATLL